MSVGILALLLVLVGSLSPDVALAQDVPVTSPSGGTCTRASGTAKAAPPLKETVTLSLAEGQAQALVNFGSRRDPKAATFIFVADKPLPASVGPANLELLADPMLRSSDTLETASFPRPRFSEPLIEQNRTRIEVDVCLDPADVEPGKYTTAITLGGPDGLTPATAGLTANLKASTAFWIELLVTTLIAGGLLIVKESWRDTGARKQDRFDLRFWLTTIASLVGAAVAMWKIWDADPTWGANTVGSFVALAGAGLSAIGVQSILNVRQD